MTPRSDYQSLRVQVEWVTSKQAVGAAHNGYAAIRRIFHIEGEAIANLSMKTRASATSTTMKNIRADGRSAKNAVVFLGKKNSKALLTIR
jgi:hypothetical protein